MLARKLGRELLRQRGQLLAVLSVVVLGTALYVASYAGYLDLSGSYQQTQSVLRLADLHLQVRSLSPVELERIRALPGVAAAEARSVLEMPLRLGEARADARVFSVPAGQQPALDRLHLQAGRWPERAGQAVVEPRFAARHHLQPGDALEMLQGDAWQRLEVAGVGVDAENLWVSRDEQDPMPSPEEFGLLWVAGQPAGRENQLLLALAPGANAAQIEAEVAGVLAPGAVLRSTPRERLLGPRLLQLDVDGVRQMALFFPAFFLGVGAFIVLALLGRLVEAQRPLIATLLALGVPRRRVLAHYLAFSAAVGLLGSLLGAALGAWLGGELTRSYATELGIPFVRATLHPGLLASGVAIGAVVSLLAGLVPARRAAGVLPAEAMRPSAPVSRPVGRGWAALARLPGSLRLGLRNLARRPGRALATALGVAAALVLVLATGGLMDSMRSAGDFLFTSEQAYDLRADLAAPAPEAELRARLGEPEGAHVELALALPVRLRHQGHQVHLVLNGIAQGATLLRPASFRGGAPWPEAGALVLSRSLASRLDVRPGDSLEVQDLSGATRQVRVSGLDDAVLGGSATMRLGDAQALFGLAGQASAVLVRAPQAARPALRAKLEALPGAGRVHDQAAMREQLDQAMGLSWAMVGAMLLLSVVLASAILYNTASLSIAEQERELATLRALGMPMRTISAAVTTENAALSLLGLLLGIPLSVLATRAALAGFDSELFSLPFVFSPGTCVSAGVGVAVVLLLAELPGLRRVAHLNLAATVRSREG